MDNKGNALSSKRSIDKGSASGLKRPLGKTGFIQHLSPQKISRGGNKYYTFQIQTSSNSAGHAACFSPTKATQMKSLQKVNSQSKSPN